MAYIGSSPTKVVSRQSANIFTYTATANQTAFTGSDANGNTLACTPSDIMVHMNGLRLEESDYTASTTTVTLGSGAAAGDEVTITAFVTFESSDHYNKSTADTRYVNTTGDTMTGNLGINGDLTVDTSVNDFGARITNNSDSSQGLQVRTSDNDTGQFILDLQSSTSATGTNYGSHFVVDKSGKCGIGLTAPTAPLTVKSPTNAEAIHVVGRSDDIGQMKFFEADHTTILATLEARNSFVNFGSVANVPLQFMTNNSERMRISSTGAVHLGGSGYTNSGLTVDYGLAGVYSYRATSNATYGLHHFQSDVGGANALKAYVDTGGNFNSVSDYRIKENVTEISDGISKVKQLRPVSYNQIGSDKVEDGFIAHELQEVLPNLVTGDKDELKDDGSPFIQAVNYQGLSATLVSALQEAIAKIEILETKVAALEAG